MLYKITQSQTRFAIFEIEAESEDKALELLWNSEDPEEDFSFQEDWSGDADTIVELIVE